MAHGYALIVSRRSLTALDKLALRTGFLGMGQQDGALQFRTQLRTGTLDDKSFILEITLPGVIDKPAFVTMMAGVLGIAEAAVDATTDFTLFGSGDGEDSRQAAYDYLTANAAAWDEG